MSSKKQRKAAAERRRHEQRRREMARRREEYNRLQRVVFNPELMPEAPDRFKQFTEADRRGIAICPLAVGLGASPRGMSDATYVVHCAYYVKAFGLRTFWEDFLTVLSDCIGILVNWPPEPELLAKSLALKFKTPPGIKFPRVRRTCLPLANAIRRNKAIPGEIMTGDLSPEERMGLALNPILAIGLGRASENFPPRIEPRQWVDLVVSLSRGRQPQAIGPECIPGSFICTLHEVLEQLRDMFGSMERPPLAGVMWPDRDFELVLPSGPPPLEMDDDDS